MLSISAIVFEPLRFIDALWNSYLRKDIAQMRKNLAWNGRSNRSGSAMTEGGQGFGYSSLTELRAAGVLGLLWEKQVVGTHQPTDLAFSHVPL